MRSRTLLLLSLALLASSLPTPARAEAAERIPPRLASVLEALAPAEQAWDRLLDALSKAGGRPELLNPSLSPALAEAVLALEPELESGRASSHRAAAGLAAVLLDVAEAAGANPAERARLAAALRDLLPGLLDQRRLSETIELENADSVHQGERAPLPAPLARDLRRRIAPGLPEPLQ